ncbi:Glycine/D-amino acid oxidase [Pseudoxanthomonas sp. GM95]|uniref:FAD-dependent oxidoreductase n=1 Tax=Pseudoxanthomonas sp. GM95 TaxID=1881043 RepID=UPI0008B773C8|nr:FAD-dependent oxidoreductase [Pseudoxanthomonas sp. GM95]SEM09475.1 Glycine/D-amino acid oxidase [Pseudoxanthomonas sp. GM95]
MHRRHFLRSAGALAAAASSGALLAQTSTPTPSANALPGQLPFAPARPLAPIIARADRVVAVTVCTRPFRAQGPRIEAERIGRRTVVHQYGHGGSGWSLSWGSAQQAVRLALATGETEIAVIGCGAIGITTARVAQDAGLKVRIYAKETLPMSRSFMATGQWTPDSRICTAEHATPAFEALWTQMASASFQQYQRFLGLPGDPIEWRNSYVLSDVPFNQPAGGGGEDDEPDYAELESKLLHGIRPHGVPLDASQHPFPVPYASRYPGLIFNISAYAKMLMDDFLQAGGTFHAREFESPRQFADLREKTLINCTGYGARALLGDESVIPVRGQTARLLPQPEVDYGLYWRGHNLNVVPRRDGILVQAQQPGDYNNADTTIDRAVTDAAVAQLAKLFPAA